LFCFRDFADHCRLVVTGCKQHFQAVLGPGTGNADQQSAGGLRVKQYWEKVVILKFCLVADSGRIQLVVGVK
jgi:hypothetical protein